MKYASKAKKKALKKQIRIENILRHIDKRSNGHWIWTGARKKDGYGIIVFGGDDGKLHCTTAHRRVWQLLKGKIHGKLEVAHDPKCPRLCVNPDHMHLTPHAGNQKESIVAGTFHFVCGHPSRFTLEQKKQIVSEVIPQHSNTIELAKEFGISRRYVKEIAHSLYLRTQNMDNQKLTPAQLTHIHTRYRSSHGNVGQIAKKYSLNKNTIMRWRQEFNGKQA
jgi:transposase-like protein